jgi:hypothetical protein
LIAAGSSISGELNTIDESRAVMNINEMDCSNGDVIVQQFDGEFQRFPLINQVLMVKITDVLVASSKRSTNPSEEERVIIDSGASSSCVPWKGWFIYLQNYSGSAVLGTDQEIPILGYGHTSLLKNVLFIPDLRIGIISTGQLDRENGYYTIFSEGRVRIYDQARNLILTGTIDEDNRLYYLDREYQDIHSTHYKYRYCPY